MPLSFIKHVAEAFHKRLMFLFGLVAENYTNPRNNQKKFRRIYYYTDCLKIQNSILVRSSEFQVAFDQYFNDKTLELP